RQARGAGPGVTRATRHGAGRPTFACSDAHAVARRSGTGCLTLDSVRTPSELTQWHILGELLPRHAVLTGASPYEENDAHRADGHHLESVPEADQHDEVEPSWAAVLNECGAPEGDDQVGTGQEHRGDAP